MAKPKYATSLRLSPDAKRLLEELARSLGVTKSAVLELAIREYARSQGMVLRIGGEGGDEAGKRRGEDHATAERQLSHAGDDSGTAAERQR